MLTALITEYVMAAHRRNLCHVYGQYLDMHMSEHGGYWVHCDSETDREIYIPAALVAGRLYDRTL